MNSSSYGQETKVYRFSRVYQLYHFAVGGAGLIVAVKLYQLPALAAAVGLFSVFMIARPLVMAVTLDQFSVTFKGTFGAKSLRRSSITAVEIKNWGNGRVLVLWGNFEKKEKLEIPDLFGFDETWDNWLSTYTYLGG